MRPVKSLISLRECANAQADLNLRWVYMSKSTFSDIATHTMYESIVHFISLTSVYPGQVYMRNKSLTNDRNMNVLQYMKFQTKFRINIDTPWYV